jgi:TrwC relaxase
VVADIAKLTVGREEYDIRELATDHEQYLSGHGESPGRWYGAGATSLGLEGEASVADFEAMFEGQDPMTGELLGRPHGRNAVPAFVQVAGRLPQLPVAVADGDGGNPGELLGQDRLRIAVARSGAWVRKRHRASWPYLRLAFQPCSQRCRDLHQRCVKITADDPLVGAAGGVAAGWGDHIAPSAPPIHTLQPSRVDVAQAGGGQVVVPTTATRADQRPQLCRP